MKKYKVKEVFYTLQGEGQLAGTPALFIRFSGCNMWTGKAEHRERDAQRNNAQCPLWCDTDFEGGCSVAINELIGSAKAKGRSDNPLVVLTGGEPLFQVDIELVHELRLAFPDAKVAVETNGTMPTDGLELDWVCLSPKVPRAAIHNDFVMQGCDEVKVAVPAYNPADYADIPAHHYFVSPQADTFAVGKSLINRGTTARAVQFCKNNTLWRLSCQQHKILDIP